MIDRRAAVRADAAFRAGDAAAVAAAGASAADIGAAALDWYAWNGRTLAFRRTSDPWAVLVSEVIAQQTQASRAATAWETFIARFATPAALAAVSPAEAIRAWRGLGYNRRAVALRAAAVRIVEEHEGRVPDTLESLEALPGIGPYTARAVLAIAFDRPVAALDTNIRRVLDRALGPLPTAPRQLQATADGYVPIDRSADWTHALMDIGATFCRKGQPRCRDCPLAGRCAFFRTRPAARTEQATRIETATLPRTEAAARSRPRRAGRFESTTRWLRGRILDRLRDAADADWVVFDGGIGQHDADGVVTALTDLARQGLVELREIPTLQARLPT